MTFVATLVLAVAVSPSLPGIPPSPPATAGMVDAVTAHRTTLLEQWLHDLNGPYREVRHVRMGTSGLSGDASPGGDTGMGGDVERWRGLVEAHFGPNTDAALRVMACESGGSPNAVNPTSGASGLFQFMSHWWRGQWDPFDPAENIARAAALSAGGTDWSHWSCKP
jgi:hypothetical protein